MAEIRIDAETCKKDGLCAIACGRAVFRQDENYATPKIVNPERCIGWAPIRHQILSGIAGKVRPRAI